MERIALLLYLNGNNELEPELWSSFYKLTNLKMAKNIVVLAQIARQNRDVTELLRSGYCYQDIAEQWSGTRRYVVKNQKSTFELLTPNPNMADTQTLYDFIIWAQTNYQAERYILLLGGHAYQFVGISPDYTREQPYLMGFPELAHALYRVSNSFGTQIDMLILDTCYASTFETLCEFARYPQTSVKNIITYIGGGPLEGLPYHFLIRAIQEWLDNEESSTEQMMKTIVKRFPEWGFITPLIGIRIEWQVLCFCKKEFHKIADSYLKNKERYPDIKTPYDLLAVDDTYPWYQQIENIHLAAQTIIATKTAKPFFNKAILPIHVLYKEIPDEERKILYSRLYFAADNAWSQLLCNMIPIDEKLLEEVSMQPVQMTDNILQAFISNANTSQPFEIQRSIKDELVRSKEWVIPKKKENNPVNPRLTIAYILPHLFLTGGIKMLLQQMRMLRRRGHRIYAVYKTNEQITKITIDWEDIDVDKEIIVSEEENYQSYLVGCDLVVAGWVQQLPDLEGINIPVFYWEQGHEALFGDIPKHFPAQAIEEMQEECYMRPCHLYSVSQFVSNVINSRYGKKTKVLNNGIDTNVFYPGEKKEEDVILLVGNPCLRFKGFTVAIKALNIVWRLGYRFRVKWACQEEPDLSLIEFPIEIFKRPSQDYLAKLYRNAGIYVFSSLYEGFGMPPLEAMASGTAVVCTHCGGAAEYAIHGYNALMVPAEDIKEMATYIILLLKDTELRKQLEQNAVETAKRFSCELKIDALENEFFSILKDKYN